MEKRKERKSPAKCCLVGLVASEVTDDRHVPAGGTQVYSLNVVVEAGGGGETAPTGIGAEFRGHGLPGCRQVF